MIGLFFEKGWAGTDFLLRIGDVDDIRNQLANKNDWACLVENGRSMGPKRDQPNLDELDKFLRSCKDRKSMESFTIKLSTGGVGCIMCAETVEEVEKMRKFILAAPEFDSAKHKRLNGLFDNLVEYLRSGEDDNALYVKISNRQYIDSGIALDNYPD